MSILEEVRCVECGEFYNESAMNGNKCFSCSEEPEEYETESEL